MATISRIQPVHPKYATKEDLLDVAKAIYDKVLDGVEKRLQGTEQRIQGSAEKVRSFVGEVVGKGLEGQGNAFRDFLVSEMDGMQSKQKDYLLRYEMKMMELKEELVNDMDRMRQEHAKIPGREEVVNRISQKFDEEMGPRGEEILRVCQSSVRDIYERNASGLQSSYQNNLDYMKSLGEESQKRLEDGLGKGLYDLESNHHEKMTQVDKAINDGLHQMKSLEAYLSKRVEDELCKGMALMEQKHREQLSFFQQAHQEGLSMIAALLERISIPAPVVRNEVKLPDVLPPEVVVNVSVPRRKVTKSILYDMNGRPSEVREVEDVDEDK